MKDSFFTKVKEIAFDKRLPFFIQHRIDVSRNIFVYYCHLLYSTLTKRAVNDRQKPIITFNCGFHGKSGGVFAIANLANILAAKYRVKFLSYPTSDYNPLLSSEVQITSNRSCITDIHICDVSCDHDFLLCLRKQKTPCIVSCHGKKESGHGLSPDYVCNSLEMADQVHFVADVQQESFLLSEDKYFVIPNPSVQITKTKYTNNAGVVGNLLNSEKNVHGAVSIALDSNVSQVHLWGMPEDVFSNPRIVVHGWERNKGKIYDSFDVLVFLSKDENCPMVVLEALSAGIPCVLSSISAFKQFERCPGVRLVDEKDIETAVSAVNELLSKREGLRESIIDYWEENYSPGAISREWMGIIDGFMTTSVLR